MSDWGCFVEYLNEYYTPEQMLAIAVIRKGLALDGPRYLTCACAKFWTSILGVEPSWLWRYAVKDTDLELEKFEESQECRHVDEKAGEK